MTGNDAPPCSGTSEAGVTRVELEPESDKYSIFGCSTFSSSGACHFDGITAVGKFSANLCWCLVSVEPGGRLSGQWSTVRRWEYH